MSPEIEVEAPTRRPLPFGLFSAANERSETRRWQNGVEWLSPGCSTPFVTGDVCEDGIQFESNKGNAMGEASPFTVYAPFECSPVAWTEQSAQAVAEARLLAGEESAVERVLMTGATGNSPSLQADAETITDTPVSPGVLIAELEQWLGESYGALGVLHVSRYGATLLADAGLIKESGSRMLTKIGTPVSVGAGYPNVGPDGSEAGPGQFWAYMSPSVFFYRGAVASDVGATLDKKKNDLLATSFRSYVVGYDDCGVAAGIATVD